MALEYLVVCSILNGQIDDRHLTTSNLTRKYFIIICTPTDIPTKIISHIGMKINKSIEIHIFLTWVKIYLFFFSKTQK